MHPALIGRWHHALPHRIRVWLHQRCISEDVITTAQLGWTGTALAIPILNHHEQLAFFKFRQDPDDRDSRMPKYWSQAGARATLYGWEHLINRRANGIVICEGELDRLCLESHGIPAVTSTGGAGVFKEAWGKVLQELPDVYVCFDNDAAGRRGVQRVAQLIPHAKIVDLPPELGPGGDITDFFVRLGKRTEDFLALLAGAHSVPQERRPMVLTKASHTDPAISQMKGHIAIEQVIGQYLSLRRSGRTYIGRCIFHDDRVPSLAVYPETQSFYCFGCGIGGDVIRFLLEAEHLTFREALTIVAYDASTPWKKTPNN